MEDIKEIRHKLHAHPGLSGEESYAHDLVVEALRKCRPTEVYDHVGGYGVVAVWGNNRSMPTLVFRGDIDALPIHEQTELPYRSEVPYVSHKCGHDGHTAIMLRLSQLLGEHFEQLNYNVIVVFQPEEETGLGSQKILDSGILQQYNVKGVFGMHNLPGYHEGTVVLNYHTFAAASTGVVYSLVGRQTHASTPEKGVNPGLAVAEIVQRMDQLNGKKNAGPDTFQQSTLICVRVGEEAFGTSAGEAQVMFTLRTFSNERMSQLMDKAHGIVQEVAAKHSLAVSYELRDPFHATENDSMLTEQLEELFCEDHRVVTAITPFRWSEDFANYLIRFPGAMFGVGAGEKHAELHHPDYDFPDEIIEPTAQMFWKVVTEIQI